jgi:ComF family protein
MFDCARSVGQYEGTLRVVIHALKYNRCRALAAPLGELMRAAGSDLLSDTDAVVPVPLHPRRLVTRGFNQAEDLARQLRLPVWHVLRRCGHGPPQASLTGARRHANVAAAFRPRGIAGIELTPAALRVARLFAGPTVVLIDDVLTTGATANACAAALIEAGVRSVRVLTVARAVAGRPAPLPRTPDLSAALRR